MHIRDSTVGCSEPIKKYYLCKKVRDAHIFEQVEVIVTHSNVKYFVEMGNTNVQRLTR